LTRLFLCDHSPYISRMKFIVLVLLLILPACIKDETVSGYTDTETVWRLVEIDGIATDQTVTIQFPEEGRFTGQAPCNRYFGAQTVPYPWFKAETIGSTKMACPDLAAKVAYFKALTAMTLIKVSGDSLLLTNDAGGSLFFEAQKGI
jgi:heat shock protein HslJ